MGHRRQSATIPSATADEDPARCQAKPGTSPREPLTITLTAPTTIASVEITPANECLEVLGGGQKTRYDHDCPETNGD